MAETATIGASGDVAVRTLSLQGAHRYARPHLRVPEHRELRGDPAVRLSEAEARRPASDFPVGTAMT